MKLARSTSVSVTEVSLRRTTWKLKCLLSLVANHHGVTAGFSASTTWGKRTCADREQQHRGEYQFHESLKKVVGLHPSAQPSAAMRRTELSTLFLTDEHRRFVGHI